jgi:3',5'-nucleoside bisphosphate phosphatase
MKNPRYDLHTHSTASDGTLPPAELIRRAAAAGIGVLALTDHDETAGLAAANQAAQECGMALVAGIELSVSWSHQTVHIVGLQIDPATPELQSGIQRNQAFRHWRAEEIASRLAKKGITGALEGAQQYAKGAILSRTHFAHYLVESGHANSLREVFKRFLVRGKPGYVPGKWASLEEALGWIRTAGGLAVIAHPARYRFSATRLRQLLGEFSELDGAALEVVSGSHSRDDMLHMANLCKQQDLAASAGSDYHGPENPYLDLGRLPPLPEQCHPVWQHPHWTACTELAEPEAPVPAPLAR